MRPERTRAKLVLTRDAKDRKPSRASKRRTGRRRRLPPSKGAKPRRRPHVVLTGNPKIVLALRIELERLGIPSILEESPAALLRVIGEATKAVVIAPPVPDEAVTEICTSITAEYPGIPIFTVMRSALPWKSEKLLYDAGSLAVFAWPKEKESLLQTLIGLVRVPSRVTNKTPSDAAIGRLVRSRLRTAAELAETRLVVRVIRGVVLLSGTVQGLWQTEVATRIANAVPGVQKVVLDSIEVKTERAPDRAIEKTVRRLIDASSHLDASTLALEVTDGSVVLAGTVSSALELERTCNLIRQLKGVTELKTFVTVSADAHVRDRRLAKRVEKALAIRHPKAKLHVSAFGGIVVLRGGVPLAETREDVAKLASLQAGVERIVNKLVVEDAGKGKKKR